MPTQTIDINACIAAIVLYAMIAALALAAAIVLYAMIAFLFTTFNVPGADCFGQVGNETIRQFCENLTRA